MQANNEASGQIRQQRAGSGEGLYSESVEPLEWVLWQAINHDEHAHITPAVEVSAFALLHHDAQ